MKMNLYLIKRNDPTDALDYDEFVGHVIAAHSVNDARRFAADKQRLDESLRRTWLTSEEEGLCYPCFSTVTLLASGVDLEEGIVLSDFIAG
tara:strand:- start:140 stop:412 length:273 start_codon:yes stop_codon:yes gene_type:complete